MLSHLSFPPWALPTFLQMHGKVKSSTAITLCSTKYFSIEEQPCIDNLLLCPSDVSNGT